LDTNKPGAIPAPGTAGLCAGQGVTAAGTPTGLLPAGGEKATELREESTLHSASRTKGVDVFPARGG